jgi:DNA-directed RNA polymerase specialized sigma24 family protein
MDKKEIIMTYVYKSESLKKYFMAKVDKKYIDELKSELYISLLEMKEEKLFKAYDEGYLDGLCIQIIKNQYNSDNSKFFKDVKNGGFRKSFNRIDSYDTQDYNDDMKYIKLFEEFIDNSDLNTEQLLLEDLKIEEDLIKIESVLKNLHWYDKTLFDMNVVDGLKMSEISRMTKISQHSILYSITKTKKKIKESLKN